MEEMIIHDTKHYNIILHPEDKDELWYWIVNKENGLVEGKEGLKPQALVYCEQYSLLLEQNSHQMIAKNMVQGLAEEALFSAPFTDESQH